MKIKGRTAGGLKSPSRGRRTISGRKLAALSSCGLGKAQSQGRKRSEQSSDLRAASGAHREMSVESLAQFCLEQLASRRMRKAVDEHDIVRHLPLRQFF